MIYHCNDCENEELWPEDCEEIVCSNCGATMYPDPS